MSNYELAVVLKTTADEASQKDALEKIKGFVTSNNGTINEVKEFGKRELAYEIQKMKEGFYAFIEFTADTQSVKPIDQICKIEESLLRYMIIKK